MLKNRLYLQINELLHLKLTLPQPKCNKTVNKLDLKQNKRFNNIQLVISQRENKC